jgi:hypothetical protein
MTFFFTGVAFMELVRRIRALEKRLKRLGGNDPADLQHGDGSARSREDNYPVHLESETGLFSDPVGWSGTVVRAWPRFALFS